MGAYIHGPIGANNKKMADGPGVETAPADKPATDSPAGAASPPDAAPKSDTDTAKTAAETPESEKAPAEKSSSEKPPLEKPAAEKAPAEKPKAEKAESEKKPAPTEIRVVLVPDIDCLFSGIFAVRAHGASGDEDEVNWALQNVTFVLNSLDVLAGDERFISIRGREPVHKTLVGVSAATEDAKLEAEGARQMQAVEFKKPARNCKKKSTRSTPRPRKTAASRIPTRPRTGSSRSRKSNAGSILPASATNKSSITT